MPLPGFVWILDSVHTISQAFLLQREVFAQTASAFSLKFGSCFVFLMVVCESNEFREVSVT
jgi:hypothetical protein